MDHGSYGPCTWWNSGNGRFFWRGWYYKTLILNYQTGGDITWRHIIQLDLFRHATGKPDNLHHGTSKLCWSATRMLGPVPLHWSFWSLCGFPVLDKIWLTEMNIPWLIRFEPQLINWSLSMVKLKFLVLVLSYTYTAILWSPKGWNNCIYVQNVRLLVLYLSWQITTCS